MTLLAIFEALVGANAIWETTVGQQSLLKISKASKDDLCPSKLENLLIRRFI